MKAPKPLTEQEMTFLRLSAAGWSIAEIAEMHGVTFAAGKATAIRLRSKLGAANITNAVHLAHKRGLLGAES